jgi:site-specific DNA-methyltransferase (adenine-specific)
MRKACPPAKKSSRREAAGNREIRYMIEPNVSPLQETFDAIQEVIQNLPPKDNERGAVEKMLRANAILRNAPWPAPFDETRHVLRLGDARQLDWLAPESVHLIVTSPPYWTLKEYERGNRSQLGDVSDYDAFLSEMDKVWAGCVRALTPGGRICCVVGDVCLPRKKMGRHFIMPLHADIQVRARGLGLDVLTPILWQKIANGVTEAQGNGAGFYGKPYQPGAIIKNDVEYILFLRKGGEYRSPTPLQRALSMLNKSEMQNWMRSSWTDIKGESTRNGHPAPYPVALAERLVKMFSFAGDTVLDPLCGTGTTAVAAMNTGRNSISVEIELKYLSMAHHRLREEAFLRPATGALRANIFVNANA